MKFILHLFSVFIAFGLFCFINPEESSTLFNFSSAVSMVFLTFGVMMAKYGHLIFKFKALEEEMKNQMARDGFIICVMSGAFFGVVDMIKLFGTLSSQKVMMVWIARSMGSVAFGLILAMALFFPFLKKRSEHE